MIKNIIFIVGTIILLINFLIIYLIFKSKRNRITKSILIVTFVVLTLVILAVGIYGLNSLQKIREAYKLYYIFFN